MIERLEQIAAANPAKLRRRGLAFVALGYAYVFTILFGVLGAGALIIWLVIESGTGAVAIKFAIALFVLGWLIARSLWVGVPRPAGEELGSGHAPKLMRRIEELRARLDAPRPDVILLDGQFNASVTQLPRLGIFGFPRTYLTLGVPLMYGVSPAQLDAILAHEFAHLSAAHPKRGLWIFRISKTWQQLLARLSEARSRSGWLFRRFFGWYVPRLHAYGYVMSRRDEYEADAEAARIVGAESMAAALAALQVRGVALGEHLWPTVWRQAETLEAPPDHAWRLLPQVLRETQATPNNLSQILKRKALEDDTHPSLGQRLVALGMAEPDGIDPRFVDEIARELNPSAAEHYLAARSTSFLAALDKEWRSSVADNWRRRHAELKAVRARADALLAQDSAGTLEPAEEWELAVALHQLDQDALPYLQRVVTTTPANAGARFLLGSTLLGRDDPAGAEHLRAAMSMDHQLVATGNALLEHFFASRGDQESLVSVQRSAYEHAEQMQVVAAERNDVGKRDVLRAASLTPKDEESFRQIGRDHDRIAAIWVAEKVTRHMPDRPMVAVIVEPARWKWSRGGKKDQELAKQVIDSVELSRPSDVLVLVINGHVSWLQKKARKATGKPVFSR